MQTLKEFFLQGAKKALANQIEDQAKLNKMMEEDIAKMEALTEEEFELNFRTQCAPNLYDIQFLAGRFAPPKQDLSEKQM